jgi:hypothetical protein
MGCRLVLVRWYGDVIGSRTLVAGEPFGTAFPEDAASGVTYEVHDIPYTRSALSFVPGFDALPLLFFALSLVAHVGIGYVLARSATPEAIEREQEFALRSYTLRLEESEDDEPASPARNGAEAHLGREPGPEPQQPAAVPRPRDAAPPSTAAALCTMPPAPVATSSMCSHGVVITSLTRSSPSCFTDTVVSVGQHGTLTFPCESSGPASLRIGSSTFDGALVGAKIEVCTGTQFPWNDGCTWTSAQRVSGNLSSGELVFTYGEAPKAGQHGCASACTATGQVRLDGSGD